MTSIADALFSLGAIATVKGSGWDGVEYKPNSPVTPTEQEVNDEIARLDAADAIEVASKENAKNDTEGMAFLDLMKSKTSAQRASWLSANVADPNVRKVLQGLMSIVLWKVA